MTAKFARNQQKWRRGKRRSGEEAKVEKKPRFWKNP